MNVSIKTNPTPQQIVQWAKNVEQNVVENVDYMQFAPIVAAETARIFVTEGYGEWAALSRPYAARKAKQRPFSTTLRLTDEYFKAATQINNPRNIAQATKKGLVYGVQGFNPNYPLFHELGTNKMPARPVWSKLSESEALQQKVMITFRRWVAQKADEESRKAFR